MNAVTEADRAARVRILGIGPTAAAMTGLPGVEACPHPLSGAGNHLIGREAQLDIEAGRMTPEVRDNWLRNPYYHHEYTPDPDGNRPGGHIYCRCGNGKGGEVHDRCDVLRLSTKGNSVTIAVNGSPICDDCGRDTSQGPHDLSVEH